jgi:hypothetical protein
MRWLWNRAARDRELDEKIRFHLRMAVQDRMESGQSDREAQESARREFGNVGLVKEDRLKTNSLLLRYHLVSARQ